MLVLNFVPLFLFAVSSYAISIPIRRDFARRSTSVSFKAQSSSPKSTGPYNFTNEGDVFYAGTITVDGRNYLVRKASFPNVNTDEQELICNRFLLGST